MDANEQMYLKVMQTKIEGLYGVKFSGLELVHDEINLGSYPLYVIVYNPSSLERKTIEVPINLINFEGNGDNIESYQYVKFEGYNEISQIAINNTAYAGSHRILSLSEPLKPKNFALIKMVASEQGYEAAHKYHEYLEASAQTKLEFLKFDDSSNCLEFKQIKIDTIGGVDQVEGVEEYFQFCLGFWESTSYG